MNRLASRIALLLSLVFALAPAAWAEDKVVFSKPADNTPNKDSAAAPDNSSSGSRHWSIGVYNAPHPDVDIHASGTAPMYVPNNNAAAQEEMNKRKNWTLLTPEQIMGVQTPEQILGLQDNNQTGRKLSLEEQFLLRLDKPNANDPRQKNNRTGGDFRNNGLFPADAQGQNNRETTDVFGRRDQRIASLNGQTGGLNRTLNGNDSGNADQNSGGLWKSVFAQPTAPKQTPEQVADMERFRSLLAPGPVPDKPETPATYNAAYNAYTPPAQNGASHASSGQTDFNPAGSIPVHMQDNATRPTGVQPLPSVFSKPPPPPAKRPEWQAQLPPWMSDKPQTPNVVHNF